MTTCSGLKFWISTKDRSLNKKEIKVEFSIVVPSNISVGSFVIIERTNGYEVFYRPSDYND